MAKHSAIEWTDSTWNPWMGCAKVSEGCKHCYAERDMTRWGRDFTVPTRSKTTFRDPLKWNKPRVIFVCSWSDFFWEAVPEDWRREAWEIMHHCPQHTFLILTKRPENMPRMMPPGWREGMWRYSRNVWLGVSAENQRRADERIPLLLEMPAERHFVSAEPLLGPIDFGHYLPLPFDDQHVDWIITGGESDPVAPRPMNPDWPRAIRDQCVETGAAFFHKQHGGRHRRAGAWGGRDLDGRTWDEMPQVLAAEEVRR